ncbi:MAG: DUF1566 domain-containing protein [Betaproteobacteria bacterium]|nr:DUF1566 domain-containing protein [Betaproteobacteria bacterium]
MRALLSIVLTLVSLPAFSSYTKIANNGSDLPASAVLGSGATQWACTRDNATGLVWEVKTADGVLRDWDKTYTNYDDSSQNQKWNGSVGVKPTQAEINAASNSIGFVNAVNATSLCGSAAWRMPSKHELLGLMNIAYMPTIDPVFFPNTPPSGFWTGSSGATGYLDSVLLIYFDDGFVHGYNRFDEASVRLVSAGQSIETTASAVEYYHAGFGHYFVTGAADEAAAIDSGAIKGWTRTGQTYSVYSQGGAGLAPVCRFFSTSFSPKSSHFYTPSPAECSSVKTNPNWQFESNAFYVKEPVGGACVSGAAPLYRIYNNGHSGAPNHRYTTCTSIRDNMISRGWVSEGVAMCVPGGSADCATDNSGGVNYNAAPAATPPAMPAITPRRERSALLTAPPTAQRDRRRSASVPSDCRRAC